MPLSIYDIDRNYMKEDTRRRKHINDLMLLKNMTDCPLQTANLHNINAVASDYEKWYKLPSSSTIYLYRKKKFSC